MLLLCALIVGSGSVWADTETVTFSEKYSDKEKPTSYEGSNFSIAFSKGSNSNNAPQYYSTGTAMRLYGGNTMTVSSSNTITKIELTFSSGEGSNTISTAPETYDNGTWEGSATSVIFTVGGTKGHRRVSSVKVTYTPAAIPVTSITLNKSVLSLAVGETETLTLSEVLPATATDKTVTWSSSNSSVASVNSSTGVVTANAVGGPVTITATANDGSGVTATCAVTVIAARVDVTGVTLNKTATTLLVGGTETLTATIAPADATNKNVVWTSSDDAVASVDEDGVVTANAVGTATITATSEENEDIKATCTVTVNPVVVTGVTLNKTSTSIMFGSTETLTATVAPANATNKNVSWTSSNTSVATVSEGVITPVSVGTTTITVTTEDQDMTATCDVTITANTTKPELVKTIFNETFNNCNGTGGRDGIYNGSIGSSDIITDNTWETTFKCGGASKCLKFGTSTESATLTSGNISLTGNATLTFNAAGWGDASTNKLEVSATDATLTGDTDNTLSNGSWNSYSVNITGATGTIKLTFSGRRGFIDDIKIVQTASSIDVTLNASGFASYCSPFALDLTPGGDVAAYAVKTIGDNKVKFTKITGKVAANTPFILYNTAKASKAVSLPIIEDDDAGIAPVTDNALIGTLSPTYTAAPSGYTNFGLSGSKFVPMNDGVVKKNKAYLQVDNDDIDAGAGAHSLEIVFDDGETTGIQSVNGSGLKVNDYFDLQGRRVAQPTRGLYIVNGKKVVIK